MIELMEEKNVALRNFGTYQISTEIWMSHLKIGSKKLDKN
jgi:hypothetical protein